MAKIDPNGNIKGLIGPLSARVVNGACILQMKAKNPKQTKRTKQTAKDFGYASKNCKTIRLAICETIYKNHDKNLFLRFTTLGKKLLALNSEFEAGNRTFFNTDMQGLVGFELNTHSPYTQYCTLPLQIQTIDKHKVVLTIDSFSAKNHFCFPEYSSQVQIDFTLISTSLKETGGTNTKSFSLHFTAHDLIPAQQWETEITLEDSFTVMIAEVWYFRKQNEHKKVCINHKEFHPSAIIYVNNGM